MKRIVLMALLALALPMAAFANTVDFGNLGGTLAGSSSGLTLTMSGSVLNSVSGLGNGLCSTAVPCGSVAFTTGALASGNLSTGATFGPGGTFVITSNGQGGLPSGVLFTGTFTGTTAWTTTGTVGVDSSVYYNLSGAISGTWYNGKTVSGSTFQMTVNAGKDGFMGSVAVASGDTNITTTPEPGTLGLLGTGLVGLAGIVRKKLKA